MKVGLLGGGNAHALAFARHFAGAGVDSFGIGRNAPKPRPFWNAPNGYRYYQAHLGLQVDEALKIIETEKPDVIVCIAAQGESAASFGEDSWRFYLTNAAVLARVASLMPSCVKRFIQISTSELYGSVGTPVTEEAPVQPTSPYALSKATFDAHLGILHRTHAFPAIIVRPSNCYCPGQQLHRVIPRAAMGAVHGVQMELRGGTARKMYLHTDDLASAVLRLIEVGKPGEIYNVGSQEPVRISDLVGAISVLAKSDGAFAIPSGPRFGEDACYWIDSTKMRRLGWRPRVNLEDGLKQMVGWARAFPEIVSLPRDYTLTP